MQVIFDCKFTLKLIFGKLNFNKQTKKCKLINQDAFRAYIAHYRLLGKESQKKKKNFLLSIAKIRGKLILKMF